MSADALYDVLVCGAGPAGTSAALAAAAAGARVAILERREKVGVPVRCAEYIPAALLGSIPGPVDYVVQRTRSMRAYLRGEEMQDLPAPGCVVRRDALDQRLAEAAVAAGATLLLRHTLVELEDAHTALVRGPDGSVSLVRADVIVGADGPLSRVARHVDPGPRQLLPAVQLVLPLLRPLDHTRVYFDESLRAGYAWLFPKGDVANVGLGFVPGGESRELLTALARFVDGLAADGLVAADAATLRTARRTGGWIPVEERPCVHGTVLLVGDAAGHTHPITGAGILQAVLGGEMAGRHAAEAVGRGRISALADYGEEWNDFYGDTLSHARGRRLAWEAHMGPLDTALRGFWIGNREYYAS